MKRILITAVIAIFALCSCTPKADKAAAVAGDFLTSFFNMDYAAAAGYCTSDIADMLRDTIAAGDYPSEEIRAKVVEASKKTSFKIVSSEVEEETAAGKSLRWNKPALQGADLGVHPFYLGHKTIPDKPHLFWKSEITVVPKADVAVGALLYCLHNAVQIVYE